MRSEERRIASQHERLDDLVGAVYKRIEGGGGASAALDDFRLFVTALEAHMAVEEEIYFPALHGLRADVGPELTDLVAEHGALREASEEIRALLEADEAEPACAALDRLVSRVSSHELAEEELIARITEGPNAGLGRSSLE
jgi:iron-sulfur cluster repair protein YtfE (RIC family)